MGRWIHMNSILDFLEESKSKYGEKLAVVDLKESWSFEKLWKQSQIIGMHLTNFIEPREPVGIFLDKSCYSIASFLGTVYAGGFYVPLNIRHPLNRVKEIVDTVKCKTVLTDSQHVEDLKKELPEDVNIILVREAEEIEQGEQILATIRRNSIDIDPLYTMFTSGSTGKPKGVVVCHRAVIDFIDDFTEIFHITSNDNIGNQAPYDFDISVKDIYSFLKTGATMYIIPMSYFSIPVKLVNFLCDNHITSITWAVSALCILSGMDAFSYRVPQIEKVLFSGEVMPAKHLSYWRKYFRDAMFVNLYGPTEITCNCSYYIIEKDFSEEQKIPIGKAFPNTRIFLLNENGDEVRESGVEGEICVSSSKNSFGYYLAPDITDKAFIQNPLNPYFREIIYKTGDYGIYGENDLLYFVSRRDHQIKHMGQRIELDEIAAHIMKIEEITRACCIYEEEKEKVIAFYEGNIEKKDVTLFLKKRLPPYMVPNKCINLEKLPITERGKIDRNELRKIYDMERGK